MMDVVIMTRAMIMMLMIKTMMMTTKNFTKSFFSSTVYFVWRCLYQKRKDRIPKQFSLLRSRYLSRHARLFSSGTAVYPSTTFFSLCLSRVNQTIVSLYDNQSAITMTLVPALLDSQPRTQAHLTDMKWA